MTGSGRRNGFPEEKEELMRKWKKAAVAAMVCLTGVLFMPSMKAEAKNPSMVELKAGKTYKSYDITGDKKKDTVWERW